MQQAERFFRQSRTLLRRCCRFWQQNFERRNFTKNSFDIVAKKGNNVEATFDLVERIIRLVVLAFDNIASTLLLVWTGPLITF